jgi:hypothetical protein
MCFQSTHYERFDKHSELNEFYENLLRHNMMERLGSYYREWGREPRTVWG